MITIIMIAIGMSCPWPHAVQVISYTSHEKCNEDRRGVESLMQSFGCINVSTECRKVEPRHGT